MSNLEYKNLFDNGLEIIEHFGGSIGIHRHVTDKDLSKATEARWNIDGKYSPTQYQEAAKKGQERMLARMFLLRCDKERYSTMLNKLANDQISERNAYPDSRLGAYTLLNNWIIERKPNTGFYNTSQYGSSFNQESGRNAFKIACWGCGKEGVVLSNCTNNDCKVKKKAREMKRNQQHNQQQSQQQAAQHFNRENLNMDFGSGEEFNLLELNGYNSGVNEQGLKPEIKQVKFGEQFNQKISSRVLRDIVILLDSQSTHITFYSKDAVVNIQETKEPLKMFTNGGSITYHHIADLPGYGTLWLNENAIANIISISEAKRKGYILLYLPECFNFKDKNGKNEMNFHLTNEGLYAFEVPRKGFGLIQTVHENERMFTPR